MSEPNKPINPNKTEKNMKILFFKTYLELKDKDYIKVLEGTMHQRHLDYWSTMNFSKKKLNTIAKIYWALIIARKKADSKEYVWGQIQWKPHTAKRKEVSLCKGEWIPTFNLGNFKMKYRSDASMKNFAIYQINHSIKGEKQNA